MATVFWGAQGVIHIDYLENGIPITSQHYLELLDRFHVDLKQKRPQLKKDKVLFPQDTAQVHTCVMVL